MINTVETAVKPNRKKGQLGAIWKRFKKNPLAVAGLIIVSLLILLAAFADVIAPADGNIPGYNRQDWSRQRQFPSAEHIFGTDNVGRDIFHRIAHGARISLLVGLVVVSVGMTIGVTLGSISGFYGGWRENIIMRFIDIILAVPNILIAIIIAGALGPGLINVMIAVGIGAIPGYARIVRGQVLSVRDQEFVEAARSIGANDFRLIRKHVLPNCMAPIIVEASMGMAGAILSAAGLSFIGVGLQPPTAEWGAMLSAGRGFLLAGYWHMTLFPGIFIAAIVFSFNMIGDGLRDALDPRLRGASFSKRKFKRVLAQRAARGEEGGRA
ncbi:MAG: ABC transporter permease [Defluviitaleaceae bacterium]|nr:ABC transporter permease [Defluviitaleaceae bacterium]